VNINIPPATQALILVNVVVYFGQMLLGDQPFLMFALWPLGTDIGGVSFGPWQLVSYGFLHAGLTHLLVNMLALFIFGSELERLFGARWYLGYYLVCIVTAAIAQLIVAAVNDYGVYPTVGASGGVFGLLLGFGMYFPRRTVVPLFPPIPMQAWVFVTLYGVLELYFGVSGTLPGIAHFAHLGGMVGGFVMILYRRNWRL